jgi:hypothetical protein
MYDLSTQDEYDTFVAELAEEFDTAVDNNAEMDVAHGVLASFEVRDGTPHVQRIAEVYGAPVTTTHSEVVSPYDVLQLANSEVITQWDATDTAAALAAELLARDLAAERSE